MVVAIWTWWVDLKVVALSRSGSLTGWSDLGVGCSHGGQIGSKVGCSRRSDWIRDGSFTGSVTMRNGSAEWDGLSEWDGSVRMRDGLVEYPLLARLKGWVFFLWV